MARYEYPLPAEAATVTPDIPALTARARTFTVLSCRTINDARGQASVWTFDTPSTRDNALSHVGDRALRRRLCRFDRSVIDTEAWPDSDSGPAFCASVGGRLG
ncbi:hypothetical protein [Baekduia sp. Peel2402]|uniref:hypothetical protein n=1 Tax=Baekduia sp. Peel2402 TaxID=3458296 RepID=UPI00403EBDE4